MMFAQASAWQVFSVDAVFLLSNGPSALWISGPWFHRRVIAGPMPVRAAETGEHGNSLPSANAVDAVNDSIRVAMREDNVFRRIFPTVIQSFPASPIDPPQPHDDDDAPVPVAAPWLHPRRRRLIFD